MFIANGSNGDDYVGSNVCGKREGDCDNDGCRVAYCSSNSHFDVGDGSVDDNDDDDDGDGGCNSRKGVDRVED